MKKASLSISFFAAGFVSTSVQIILIRELLTVLYGNELSFAFIYFFWFLSIGLGAFTASRMPAGLSAGFLISLFIALSLLPSAQTYLIRSFKVLIGAPPGEWMPLFYVFIASSVTVPLGLVIGLLFPCASGLGAKEIRRISRTPSTSAGFVYSLESLGSTCAGLIVSLVCLKYYSHSSVIMVTSAVSSLTALLLLSMIPEKRRILTSILIIVPASLILSLGKTLDSSSLRIRWESISNAEKTVETDSLYQNIAIGRQEDRYSIFGNGSYIASVPDEHARQGLAHFLMILHPEPKNVLLAAEGFEEMIHHMLKHDPLRIDLLQTDSKIHDEIAKYLPANTLESLKNERVSILFDDTRKYLNDYPGCKCMPYDLIVSLPPDPTTLNLNRYYTAEFFSKAKESLCEGGIFVTSVTSTENYLSGDVGAYLGSVYKTLAAVFDDVTVIPGPKAYLVASKSRKADHDLKEMQARFIRRKIRSDSFNEHNLSSYFQKTRIETAGKLLQDNLGLYALNSDLKPATFLLNLKILSGFSKGFFERSLKLFTEIRSTHILFLVVALALGSLLILFRPRAYRLKFLSLLSITTTGIISFALQMLIIYFYQARHGYIYGKVGLIIGSFMFGLFAGSILGNRVIEKIPGKSIKALILSELLLGLFLMILPVIFVRAPGELVIMTASLTAGLFTGAEFPLANKIYFEQTDLINAASRIDSLDHFGAAFGAIASGLILVPVLGITMTCIILLSIKAGTLILWTTVLKGRS